MRKTQDFLKMISAIVLIGSIQSCNIKECKPGMQLDNEFCECVKSFGPTCRIGCPRGMVVYSGLCKCIKPYECAIKSCKSPGFINFDCECEMPQDYCDIECPFGTEFEFPCQCVPKTIIEPMPEPPMDCNITRCKPGLKLDEDNCECAEFPGPTCRIGCPPGMTVYPGFCQCIKPYDCGILACKYPASPNFGCECEMPQDYCDIECPTGTEFEFPCQCVPM